MKKNYFSFVKIIVLLIVAFVMLTGCDKKKDDDSKKEGEFYTSAQTLEWNETGKYFGEITLPEDSNESFKDFSNDDFEFIASIYVDDDAEEPCLMKLKTFTVTKVDAKTLRYEFTSPLDDNFDVRYVLSSTKSIVSDNGLIYLNVLICEPDIYLTGDALGAYVGSTVLVLNVEFGDAGKFVSELLPSMFTFPEELNSYVEVERISDKKATITVKNIPTDLNTGSIDVVVSKYAIDSKFAKDITLNVDYSNPGIDVDYDSISYDEEACTLTIGRMYVKNGTGVNGSLLNAGFDIVDDEIINYGQILTQDYNEEENYYSLTFKVNNDVKNVLQKLSFLCDIKLTYETIPFKFNVSLDDPYINIELGEPDTDENTIAINLNIKNGKFKDDLTVEEIHIVGNELLTNFEILKADEKQVILKASFPADTSLCEVLDIRVNNVNLTDTFTNGDSNGLVDVIVITGDRYDWTKFALRVSKNSLGLIKNPVLSKIVIPELLNYFELDTSDNKNKKVEQQIKELRAAVEDLSGDIINLKDYITVSEFRSFLESTYTPLDSKLSLILKSYMSKDAVVEYITESSKQLNVEENRLGEEDYAKFIDFLKGLNYDFNKHRPEVLRSYYTSIQKGAKNLPFYGYCAEYRELFYRDCVYPYRELDGKFEQLHGFFQTAHPLVDIVIPELDEGLVDRFIKATDDTLTNLGVSDYIANIKLYGDYITSSNIGHGVSTSVIEKYFSVCDGIYNFESQTIEPKKAFLAKLQYTYLFNAAFAKQIMAEKGENAIAEELGDQMVQVQECLDKYWKEIDEMESRQKAGKDGLLVCSPIIYVSKSLVNININDFHGRHERENSSLTWIYLLRTMGSNVVKVSAENYLEMCERAKARHVTLADDLTNAGFKNVKKDSKNNTGTKYSYLTGPVEPEYKYVSTWKETINIFGGLFDYMKKGHKVYTGTVVTQSTTLDAKKFEKTTICDNVEYEKVGNFTCKGYVNFYSNYEYLIGFQK